jgi:hypothetical protein
MENAWILGLDLITLTLILLLTGIMLHVRAVNKRNANSSDKDSVFRLQQFLLSYYNRLTSLERLTICVSGLDVIANLEKLPTVIFLGTATALLIYTRYLANKKLVPIHKQVMKWNADYIPGKWRYLRNRWDYNHMIRTILISMALLLVFIAASGKIY